MNKLLTLLAAGALLSAVPESAHATDLFTWNDHAAPFPFRFGNDLDTHALTRVTKDGNLFGLLYIQFTGTTTKDGYRVASHADCSTSRCTVGWTLNGKSLTATLLSDAMDDHPLFTVNRGDIPEPGAFVHFHWLGALPAEGQQANGYVLELVAVDRFCFIHHDAANATSAKTCRDDGGVKVEIGVDVASHLNIVPATSMAPISMAPM
jgi:hypothetical protein